MTNNELKSLGAKFWDYANVMRVLEGYAKSFSNNEFKDVAEAAQLVAEIDISHDKEESQLRVELLCETLKEHLLDMWK